MLKLTQYTGRIEIEMLTEIPNKITDFMTINWVSQNLVQIQRIAVF